MWLLRPYGVSPQTKDCPDAGASAAIKTHHRPAPSPQAALWKRHDEARRLSTITRGLREHGRS